MKPLIALGLSSLLLGCTAKQGSPDMKTHSDHAAHDHKHHGSTHTNTEHTNTEHAGNSHTADAMLIVSTRPTPPITDQPVELRMMIHNADGSMVHHFDVMHEEKVHLAIISENFEQFAHVHPTVDSTGNLKITHTFPTGGHYRLFADYTPVGGSAATVTAVINVDGPAQSKATPVPNAPGTIEVEGVKASISAPAIKAGSSSRVSFTLRDSLGQPLALDTYMGELGHLMFVSTETWQYVHVHPVGGVADQGAVEFEAHFTTPGVYKGWGQFKHKGLVKVVPFVVRVE